MVEPVAQAHPQNKVYPYLLRGVLVVRVYLLVFSSSTELAG